MTRYILNSAVITSEGTYTYRLIRPHEAVDWMAADPPPLSTIGYAETAAALEELVGVPVAVDRRTIEMQPGDEALVFRLRLPPGSPRIDPRDKGRLGALVRDPSVVELGVLRRTA